MTSSLPIADTPDALTAEWLTAALRTTGTLGPAESVALVTARPIGTGQMCDSIRLTLAFDGPSGAPTSVVAKLPAADETSRATAKALRNYETEVRFYQHLANELPIRTPAVHYADIDVESARFVLLLEDMAPAGQGDQLAGCTPDVAKIAVDELVKLHAPRWNDPELSALEWLHRDPAAQRAFLGMLLPGLWDGFRERYAARLGPEVHEAGSALFARLGAYLDPSGQPSSIVHGDYRLDNLLFDPTPGGVPVTVVDWQTCTVGSPLQDVAYFVGAGMLPDDRRLVEVEIVRGYHAGLLANGVADYPWERCWDDYRRGAWSGLVMALAASMLVERTERGDEMFLTMAHRHAQHALDLDAVALLE